MADSPRKRYSRSPSPYKGNGRLRSRSRSPSRGRSLSRSPRPRSFSRSRSGSRARQEALNPGNTLYVTGLSTRVMERDLEEHFSKKGKVAGCLLVVEPRTRLSRGFAFVTMENTEDADRCIRHLNQSVLLGRYITVEKKTNCQAAIQMMSSNSIIHLNLSLMDGQPSPTNASSSNIN